MSGHTNRDSRRKSAGMEFVNPLAPPTITPDIYKRWRDRVRIANGDPAFNPNSPSGSVFQSVATMIGSLFFLFKGL